MRKILAIFTLVYVLSVLNAAEWVAPGMELLPESHPESVSDAKWIWYKTDSKTSETCFLRLKVMIDEPVESATFHAHCDPKGTFFLNGQKLTMAPYAPEQKLRGDRKAGEADITQSLRKGENIIAVAAEKTKGGRGGIILRGEIKLKSGKSISLASTSAFKGKDEVSGEDWMNAGFDDAAWIPAWEQGDVRLLPWCDFNNMAAIFCTPAEYSAYVKFLQGQPLPPGLDKEPDAKPKIVYHGIIPGIEINGKVLPPYIAEDEAYTGPQRDDIVRKMYLAGCRIFSIVLQPNRFRLPSGEFDFSEVGYGIRQILAMAPDSYIEINYAGWERYLYFLKENPDEAAGYARAGKIPGSYLDTTFAPSLASVKFRGEVRRVIGELGKYCRTQPWYKRIIGVHTGFGNSGDGMPWGSHCMPDTGKRMAEAFRSFLKEKYKTNDSLRKAWGDAGISFDHALVPDAKERWGQEHYLHDPANPIDCRVVDYYKCYHEIYSDSVVSGKN